MQSFYSHTILGNLCVQEKQNKREKKIVLVQAGEYGNQIGALADLHNRIR